MSATATAATKTPEPKAEVKKQAPKPKAAVPKAPKVEVPKAKESSQPPAAPVAAKTNKLSAFLKKSSTAEETTATETKVEAPKVEAPKVEAPKVEAPKVEAKPDAKQDAKQADAKPTAVVKPTTVVNNSEGTEETENKNIKLDPGEDFKLLEDCAILLALHDGDNLADDFADNFEVWFENIKTKKTNEIMDELGHNYHSDKGVSKRALKVAVNKLKDNHKKIFKENKKIIKDKKNEIRKRENFVKRGLEIFGRSGFMKRTDELMDKVVNDYIAWLVEFNQDDLIEKEKKLQKRKQEKLNNKRKTEEAAAEEAAEEAAKAAKKEIMVKEIVNRKLEELRSGGSPKDIPFVGGGWFTSTDTRFIYIQLSKKRDLYFHVVKNHKLIYFDSNTLDGKEKEWIKRRQKLIDFISYLEHYVSKAVETMQESLGVPVGETPTGGRKKTSKIHIYLGTKPPKKKKTRRKHKRKPKKKPKRKPKKKPKKKPKRKKGVRGKSPPTKKRNKKKLNNKNKKTRRKKQK